MIIILIIIIIIIIGSTTLIRRVDLYYNVQQINCSQRWPNAGQTHISDVNIMYSPNSYLILQHDPQTSCQQSKSVIQTPCSISMCGRTGRKMSCTIDIHSYSLSNVILADEKSTLFHQYLRYSHKYGTIVFSIPGAIQ